MRNTVSLNQGWQFYKNQSDLNALTEGVTVDLPHTWNAKDGQDGGNDFYRGTCYYAKSFDKLDLDNNG